MGLGEEFRLAWFVCLNAVVLASAWRIGSRLGGRSLSQAILDTLLLNYLIEYVIVCGLGVCGLLSPTTVTLATAATGIAALAWTSRRKTSGISVRQLTAEGRAAMAIVLFAGGYLLSYAVDHRFLPVLETDALAYHLPTAIGWLQSGHLQLFEAWYWNPANTFSPLAAEAFMAWLIAPMQSDVFVRYVQTPALLIVGLAMYRIGRQLGARPIVAACVAVAAMLSRSIFAQATLVKDDLFVAAFFIAAVAGMGEVGERQNQDAEQSSYHWIETWRIGIAVGLLVATKYPALLTLPLLLLLVPSIVRVWTAKQCIIVISAIAILAGPWFIRNWIEFGNPLFPMIIRIGGWTVFNGIFNVTRDASTRTPLAIWTMVSQGYFGTPAPFLGLLAAIWIIAAAIFGRNTFSAVNGNSPSILRFAIWGPVIGPIVFSLASPHPEIRYFFPFLLPLFASTFVGLRALGRWPSIQLVAAGLIALAATMTSFESGLLEYVARFAIGGIVIAGLGWTAATLWNRSTQGEADTARSFNSRWPTAAGDPPTVSRPLLKEPHENLSLSKRLLISVAMIGTCALALAAYINWRSYTRSVIDAAAGVWSDQYGPIGQAWIAARDQLPADATIAYANTYLIYPLYGPHNQRHVVYAPVRPGEHSFADLPHLGDRVPQGRIVETVTAAMNEGADEATWLNNLQRLGVSDLFIAKHERSDNPPELRFAQNHPSLFEREFENGAAVIYRVRPRLP